MKNKKNLKDCNESFFQKWLMSLLFLIFLFLFLSLVSFSESDVTLFSRSLYGTQEQYENYFGWLGAQVAFLLFYLLGLGVIPFVVFLMIQLIQLHFFTIHKKLWLQRFFSYPQLFASYWLFLGSFSHFQVGSLPFTLGGFWGKSLFDWGSYYLGFSGLRLLAGLGFLFSLSPALGWSFSFSFGKKRRRKGLEVKGVKVAPDLSQHQVSQPAKGTMSLSQRFFQVFPVEPSSGEDLGENKIREKVKEFFQEFYFPGDKKILIGPHFIQIQFPFSDSKTIKRVSQLQEDLSVFFKTPAVLEKLNYETGFQEILVERNPPGKVSWQEGVNRWLQKKEERGLPLFLGLNPQSDPLVVDLMQAPHVLIAGATGMGKSNLLHSCLVSSLLLTEKVWFEFVLVDPKKVEFSSYERHPFVSRLLTQEEEIHEWLFQLNEDLEKRFQILSQKGFRSLAALAQSGVPQPFPFQIVVIDELATLMLGQYKVTNLKLLTLILQKARAAGIHFILATQRPSVDLLSGSLKVNLPFRLALPVRSFHDSRTILDSGGAEKLQRPGDALFLQPGSFEPELLKVLKLDDDWIERILDFLIQSVEKKKEKRLAPLLKNQNQGQWMSRGKGLPKSERHPKGF